MHSTRFQTRDKKIRVLDLRVNERAHATGSMFRNECISSRATDGAMVGWARMFSVPASAVPPGHAIAGTVPAPQRVPRSLYVAHDLATLYGCSVQFPH